MNSREIDRDSLREYVLGWLRDEAIYQAKKFGDGDFARNDDERTPEFIGQLSAGRTESTPPFEETYWRQQLDQYLHRTYVLGLENPNGRQALAKFVATGVGFLESTIRLYGELPEPGVTSGENLDKLRPIK